MKNIQTTPQSRLTLSSNGVDTVVDLYSPEGADLVNILYLKLAAQFQWMYLPTWLGRPIIQVPHDVVAMKELIWTLKPDLIIETGVAHGGSLVLSASILELIGKGRVLGIDIEIRPHNREALDAHPLRKRIDLLEGSSIDPKIVAEVYERAKGAELILVVLDSKHTREHVLGELDAYHGLIKPGGYIVAMDTATVFVCDIPRGKVDWAIDHPLDSVHQFLEKRPDFEIDPHYTRFGVTCSPQGFLKRKPRAENAACSGWTFCARQTIFIGQLIIYYESHRNQLVSNLWR